MPRAPAPVPIGGGIDGDGRAIGAPIVRGVCVLDGTIARRIAPSSCEPHTRRDRGRRTCVFGRQILVERKQDRWVPFYPGTDGKRRPAHFVIPDFLEADELGQYLGDLFLESATPDNGDVKRLDLPEPD